MQNFFSMRLERRLLLEGKVAAKLKPRAGGLRHTLQPLHPSHNGAKHFYPDGQEGVSRMWVTLYAEESWRSCNLVSVRQRIDRDSRNNVAVLRMIICVKSRADAVCLRTARATSRLELRRISQHSPASGNRRQGNQRKISNIGTPRKDGRYLRI
ncbi:hypothetical protein FA13DRAFT_1522995 [Coprinellus micaceus]|uniref:Uncharacterized protein n=1 Tax=Coprinellus micaceus TaxID=71717 RepID=A0A4Y7SJY9_COPMI|nr:hypothetical protein FA13DRAFT_1522995 [Coprinellus micaceus]